MRGKAQRRGLAALACAWLAALAGADPLAIGEPRAAEPFTLEQRLLDAARRGDEPTLDRALALGAPLEARDELARGPLLLAARDARSLALVERLHARGAALDAADAGGRAALSWAAAAGDLTIVDWLLAHGAELDRADVDRRTPLFHAAAGGHLGVARALLGRGAQPNAADRFGDTPLIVACSRGQNAMAVLLIASGADPVARNQEGRTAADRAAPSTPACQAAAAR